MVEIGFRKRFVTVVQKLHSTLHHYYSLDVSYEDDERMGSRKGGRSDVMQ